ncbi:MAG: aspartate kinase [Candidatus Nanoarchaeia archaeon]
MQNNKVCKFGGTSLANREQIEKAIDIVLSDSSRKYIVVSAPGKRNSSDTKITDQLISLYNGKVYVKDIISRYADIIPEEKNLVSELECELVKRRDKKDLEEIKAFGEYACAKVFSKILNHKGIEAVFSDPACDGFKVINENGNIRPEGSCYKNYGKKLLSYPKNSRIIIPGFYGADSKGKILTLPRSGSDTSGAVAANAIDASVYENWTDEDGLKRADPRIIPDAEVIRKMTFREARELAYMGFKLQEESMLPVLEKNITLNVRNTSNPKDPGTLILGVRNIDPGEVITGVACKKPYLSMSLVKTFMNSEIGFGRKVLEILEDFNVSYEHSPTGIDSMSLLIHQDYFKEPCILNEVRNRMMNELKLESCEIEHNFSLVSIVGLGMQYSLDADIRILTSLRKAGIDRRMLNEGAKDLSLFIGVNEEQSDLAVKAIYDEFFRK